MSSSKPNFVDVSNQVGRKSIGNIYGKIKNQKIVNANYAKNSAFQKLSTNSLTFILNL